MADGILTPCNVACGSGMTCYWIRPNVRHIGILHIVSISTTSPQSTCHSAPAPVFEILSKSDHPRRKKDVIRFSRWRISAILDFRDPIMGSLKAHLQLTELLSFPENRVSWILASTSKMAAAVNNSSYHRTIPALWLVFTAFNSLIRFKLQVWQKQVFAGRNPTLLSNNNNKWRW